MTHPHHPFISLRICPACGADPVYGSGLQARPGSGQLYCPVCGWQEEPKDREVAPT